MTQRPPSLEVVSDENRPERRRLTRLNVTGELFRLALNGKIFSVMDLSEEGLALRIVDGADLAVFPVATRIEGLLSLRGEKLEIQAKVMNVGPDRVGLHLEGLRPETRKRLRSFLDPVSLGQGLRPIPSSDEDGALWYHGPSGTDALFWRSIDGQYRRWVIFVLGSYIQWEEGAGMTTGRVAPTLERSETRGVLRMETLLLEPDSKPDWGKLSVAKTVVVSSNLPQGLKNACLRRMDDPMENKNNGP